MIIARTQDQKLGTLSGVFIPNILQMMGVVVFLRMGWILGHIGPIWMGIIIAMCSSILLVTSLSMSAIVSNMKVEGGGAYYLISRILGVEFGSAIGILLTVAQNAGIALCITGFALSFQEVFPQYSLILIETITLFVLALISLFSTQTALKSQLLIFVVLMGALLSIFLGRGEELSLQAIGESWAPLSFWAAFALFFPATTGIETGMSLSGDLRSPGRSLTLGTLGSVLVAFLLYFLLTMFLSYQVPSSLLRSHPFVVHNLAKFGPLVMVGVLGVFLSNALSNLLGAPRILQALSKDRVLPAFLAKGEEPRAATILVFAFALLLTLATDLNHLIPLLTMICLVLYGLINFAAFFQALMRNPSWRPSFQIHWSIPLMGSMSCFFLMFMINAGAAFLVLGLTVALCLWITGRKVEGNWDDLRHSLFSFLVHKGAAKLSQIAPNPKSWRPNLLTLLQPHQIDRNLLYFSHALDHGKGFLTFSTCGQKEDEEEMRKTLKNYQIPSFIHVNPTDHTLEGMKEIIQNYGFGPLKPNTFLLSLRENSLEFLAKLLKDFDRFGKNILLFKDDGANACLYTDRSATPKQINLWWRGQNQRNFELSMALSYSLKGSGIWDQAKICIKSIVGDETKMKKLNHVFERSRERMRIKDVLFEPILDPEEKFFADLMKHSNDADFTFIGFRGYLEGETEEEYLAYLNHLMEKTAPLTNIAFVLAGENLNFEKIFD